jgi:hypothetical protein
MDRTTHRIYPRVGVGDFFYVREPWAKGDFFVEPETHAICYRADKEIRPLLGLPFGWKLCPPVDFKHDEKRLAVKWKSSIHMPKWAARLWLKVARIRIQRVQQISEADAIAEGCKWHAPGLCTENPDDYIGCWSAKTAFQELWNSIHKDKHPWEANEWCLAYSFERVDR